MNQIIYLLSGPGHLPNLVVSLCTLREHYDGPVTVFAWPESIEIVRRIASDIRNVAVVPHTPAFHGHSDTYCDKTTLIQLMPKDDAVLFLDADTTIHGSLDPLFEYIDHYGFTVAQFNGWVTTGKTISKRINTLKEFAEIDTFAINRAQKEVWPSVNTGIFGGRPDSPVLELWHRWTTAAKSTFIPDEKVMNVIAPQFVILGQLRIATGGQWNCSPMHQPEDLPDDQVIIWHFHGDCNCRPKKSKRGWEMWKPLLQQCVDQNVGGIREWLPTLKHKHLKHVLQEIDGLVI